jgi:hypothetical protein
VHGQSGVRKEVLKCRGQLALDGQRPDRRHWLGEIIGPQPVQIGTGRGTDSRRETIRKSEPIQFDRLNRRRRTIHKVGKLALFQVKTGSE